MKKLYAIFSARGLHIERTWGKEEKGKSGEKRVILYGKQRAENTAEKLTKDYHRRYWIKEVKLSEVEL